MHNQDVHVVLRNDINDHLAFRTISMIPDIGQMLRFPDDPTTWRVQWYRYVEQGIVQERGTYPPQGHHNR